MILQKQRTLKTEISYTGIGLHSGREVHATLKPAPEDTGIVFVRTDLPGAPQIHAKAENVTSTLRATTVEEDGHKVFTIEHLMSAFHAHRIDNAYVELDSEEPPVADGASLVFFELMAKAGIAEQAKDRKEIVIDKVYRIDDEKTGRFVMVLPYDGFRVSFTSLNPHKLIGVQYEDFHIDEAVYHKEIAPARTIAYEKEIQALREMGLGLGGSLENVIVYNDEGWLNPLHFEDELVRHKILDVIGDLRLAGIIRGHVIAAASGHALNTQLAKEIAAAYAGR
ncbi:MAG: UDP-3-O-acyl-N-acetylglucosamine deacetylase [Mitsuokella jalaludinii]|uniref:UDP-3-O-acyl-N-acetylglucosamine deacetylase n=1 Tax=uncultured Mitsuokella sp. TaxID=453120 RepID=UPI002431B749|nr:UDP-3-O-acyl-N-acetylglucosamine deacetylase [Mitsuokella jalaludinii]MCI6612513.1 UDP-3-O-acyl-N-acetylglucosamine deacetylase [Mitsuokella jalaludinii]MCI7063395.1 UDP-3-O-acyl-N-acetylglucosamine deacetylase [Mitsuokella jalaludinii]